MSVIQTLIRRPGLRGLRLGWLAGLVLFTAVAAVVALWGPDGPEGLDARARSNPETSTDAVPVVASSEQDAASESEQVAAAFVITEEIFLTRDPFERVVPEPVAAPVESPEPTDPLSSDETSAPLEPPAPDAPGCTDQGELVCHGQVVTLLNLASRDDEQVATIQVDDIIYEVGRNETFARNYQVRSVHPPCVNLLHGDDGFELCVSDEVLK